MDGQPQEVVSHTPESLSEEQRALVEENLHLLEDVTRGLKAPALLRQDLAQEGYFGLLKAAVTFDRRYGVPFASWARLLIRQGALDALERHTRRVHLDDPYSAVEGDPAELTEQPASGVLPRRQERATVPLVAAPVLDVRRALEQLPPNEYLALELCNIHGLTLREAGAILSIRHGTVRYRQQRGLELLRGHLIDARPFPRQVRRKLMFQSTPEDDDRRTVQTKSYLIPAWPMVWEHEVVDEITGSRETEVWRPRLMATCAEFLR